MYRKSETGKMDRELRGVRIVDIARMAGVSVGTVDRVIHKRGRVSEENRKKVEAVLEMVHYQPNLLARSLASKKQYRLVAMIPSYAPGEYWEAISLGIDRAAEEMVVYNVTIVKCFFDQYDNQTFDEAANALWQEKIDGVLVATLFTDSVMALSERLDYSGIPYVYVDSNIGGQRQLAYFGTDSYDAGAVAARLLTDRLSAGADLLLARIVRRGKNDSTQERNRREGFCHYLAEHGFAGQWHEVGLRIDDAEYNATQLDDLLHRHPQIEGAVIFNAACYTLGNYLKQKNNRNIKLVGYDLIERNTRLLSEGFITALVAQRPERQGYEGIKTLCRYWLYKQLPQRINLMPIDILLKENVKYYLNNKL